MAKIEDNGAFLIAMFISRSLGTYKVRARAARMTGIRGALIDIKPTIGSAESGETSTLESIDPIDACGVVETRCFQAVIYIWSRNQGLDLVEGNGGS